MIKLAKSANTSTSHNINKQHEHRIKSHTPLSIMGDDLWSLFYTYTSKNSGDCLPSILTITATFACNAWFNFFCVHNDTKLCVCYCRVTTICVVDLTYQVIDLNCLIRLPINIDILLQSIRNVHYLFVKLMYVLDQSKLILYILNLR